MEGLLLVQNNNREHFGRKVYLDEMGVPKYMRSTIGDLFKSNDKKSLLDLDKNISEADLKGILSKEKRSGSIGA